tara:strand:+ start:61 stop:822 length:762 start_codon:yes stop_codon:yes gene_type:complete
MAEEQKQKFASEVIDLPSKGKCYPKDSPLSSGKLEIKYMTAREEDILTSQNLLKKGIVIEKLLDSLILTGGITTNDLILGDKNAVMVAARILAYGPDYTCEVTEPNTGQTIEHTFNLADCPFKKIDKKLSVSDTFSVTLPISKKSVKFKLLTGKEEKLIEEDVKALHKIDSNISRSFSTRLKYSIIEADGNSDRSAISNFVDNMLSRDSLFLRGEINKVSPDIELTQEVEIGGEMVTVTIPMTTNFFWPSIEL